VDLLWNGFDFIFKNRQDLQDKQDLLVTFLKKVTNTNRPTAERNKIEYIT